MEPIPSADLVPEPARWHQRARVVMSPASCRRPPCGRQGLDRCRRRSGPKSEYARLQGRERRYIKGQKYTLLSRKENLSLDGKKALKGLLAANKRLNT